MAALSISQALPRFLLPRLSWQSMPLHHNTVRALSTVPSRYNGHSRPRDAQAKRLITRFNGSLRPRSNILENPVHCRAFHATARRARDHHFDTLKFVQRLQEEGFTEAQAVAMMKVLSDVIEERFVGHQALQSFVDF
jgi:predicted DsbA family dithiol-disulfide isomerase